MVQLLWITVWSFLKKLKIEFLYHVIQESHSWGMYPDKTVTGKNIHTPMFIAALFTIAKIWEQPRHPSTDKWIKMWYI